MLTKTFSGLKGKVAAATLAGMLTLGAADVFADDKNNIATAQPVAATMPEITGEQARAITAKAHAMQDYSEDPETQGIGVFINVQSNAPEDYGDQIGTWIKEGFASQGVEVDYRINQSSRGTATDVTFYVRGLPLPTMTAGQVKSQVYTILAHHRVRWQPETAATGQQASAEIPASPERT